MNTFRNFIIGTGILFLVLGSTPFFGCATKKEGPPLAIPSVDPLMARRVTIGQEFKDAIVFNGAESNRDNEFAVTIGVRNRFDKPQRAIVRWEWFDSTGMKLSPGRNEKPQTYTFPGRKDSLIKNSAPQPGVVNWHVYISPVGKS